MNLHELDKLLAKIPVYLSLDDIISLYFLDDVTIIFNKNDFWKMLDSYQPMPSGKYVIIDDADYRLPHIRLKHNPFNNKLNDILLFKYEEIMKSMLTQQDIAQEIVNKVNAEIVVLILIDGMSYTDCIKYNPKPCMVNGPTITPIGFRNVIYGSDDVPLMTKLYNKGYKKRLGFTYWNRQNNELTDILYRGFAENMIKVEYFNDILQYLESTVLQPFTYLQIIRAGLDSYAHGMREKPSQDMLIEQIFDDILKLKHVLKSKGLTTNIFVTSDHGLLWKDDKHDFKIIESGRESPRYSKGFYKAAHSKIVESHGDNYTLMDYPYMLRNFKSNELGVHGGISFEESIVPFIEYEV